MIQAQCIYTLCYLWGSLALEYKAYLGKKKERKRKREEERNMLTGRESGKGWQNDSQARAIN
jgi:hypothetical protein